MCHQYKYNHYAFSINEHVSSLNFFYLFRKAIHHISPFLTLFLHSFQNGVYFQAKYQMYYE